MGIYAGIGSRETPPEILDVMSEIGLTLGNAGFVLRSGHAPGADTAFERGARDYEAEIYLPWPTFNKYQPIVVNHFKHLGSSNAAYKTVDEYHPNPKALNRFGRSLHARNAHIILGADLKSPVEFVICWTKDGRGEGGTGQAIRIAAASNIRVYDLAKENDYNIIMRYTDVIGSQLLE